MSAPTLADVGSGNEEEPPVLPEKVMAVLNGIRALVAYWGQDMRNHLANDAYVDYLGLTPRQVHGSDMREVLGEELFARNLPYVRAALAGEEQLFDQSVVDASGLTRHVQVSYIPDRRDDVVQGFFVLVTDVSERVRAQQSLSTSVDQYRALARSMPSGFVLVFDEDLRFLIADGAELPTFGFTRESLEGRRMPEAFEPERVAEIEPRYRAALLGESTTWEREIDRRTFKFHVGPVRNDDGVVVSGMVTATDITAERSTQRTWAALHAIATEVARQADPDAVAGSISAALVDLFGVDNAAVVRFTGPDSAEILSMAPSLTPMLSTQLQLGADDISATAQVLATGQPAIVRYPTAPGRIAGQMSANGMRVGLAAPVHLQGELWGAIGLVSSEEIRDDGLLERLASFAELLELAVGATSAWDTLSREAATDPLTGLANRRTFDSGLRREFDHAQRHGRSLSVAVLDLDHFKSVNDRFGHPVGDRVLTELGRLLGSVSREPELIARLGGEEFGWVLPGTDEDAAALAAERLRVLVGDATFEQVGHLTLSIGIAGLDGPRRYADERDLLAAADRALYAAKQAGRDRVSRQPHVA